MKIAEYNDMMSYLTRPADTIGGGVIQGEDLGSRTGFAEPLPVDVQNWLKETFPNANLNFTSDRKYGILKKENVNLYQTIERAAKQKQKNKEFVYKTTAERNVERTGKQSTQKIKETFKKNFLEKKVDKPTFSRAFKDVKFKNKKQEEQYIKLLKDKYSKPASGKGSITNAEIAKKFNISDFAVQNINGILSKKLNLQYPKSKAFYEAQGNLTPQQKSLLKAIEKRKKSELELQGRKFSAVKESGKVIHHIMPLGGKEKITAQGLALIDDEMNRAMIEFEKPILYNARRIKEIYENQIKYGDPDSPLPKNIQEEIKKINMENRGYVELAKKKLPKKYRGLIGYYEYEPTDLTQPVKRKGINPNLSVVGIEEDDFVLKENPEQSKQLAKQIRETTADIAGTKELEQIKQLQVPTDNILQNIAAGKESQAGFMRADVPLELLKGAGQLGLKALGPLGTVAGTAGIEGALATGRPIEETVKDPLTGLALVLPEAGKNVVRNARLANLLNLGMKASTLARMTPIGLGITGLQLGYGLYEKGQEQKAMMDAMTPYQRELYESQLEGEALAGEAQGFKTGGPVDKKSKKDLPGQKDPNLPIDPSRRDFLEGSGALGLGALLAAKGFMKFGPEIKKTTQAAKVSPLTKIVAPLGKTETQFPQWFPKLFDKLRKEGIQTPIYGSKKVGISEAEYNKLSKEEAKDYYDNYMGRTDEVIEKFKAKGEPRYSKFVKTDEIIGYKYQLKNQPDLTVSEFGGETAYIEFPNDYGQEVQVEYIAPKGNKDAQFIVSDAFPEKNYVDDHTEFYSDTVDNIDDVAGGIDLEKYTLGSKKGDLD